MTWDLFLYYYSVLTCFNKYFKGLICFIFVTCEMQCTYDFDSPSHIHLCSHRLPNNMGFFISKVKQQFCEILFFSVLFAYKTVLKISNFARFLSLLYSFFNQKISHYTVGPQFPHDLKLLLTKQCHNI